MLANILRQRLPMVFGRACFSDKKPAGKTSQQTEPNFLEMVESYFDKAASHTKIPADKLNLYKKSECVIKFHLTLKRGKPAVMQTMAPSRPFRPSDASTRLTRCPAREERDLPLTWTLRRSRHSPV